LGYVGGDRVDIQERINVLTEQKIKCPVCGNEANFTVSEYRSLYETLVITTIKCGYCGYRKSDVTPIIEEDEDKCLKVKVEHPKDLSTLIFVPPSSSIELPELEVKIDFAEFTDIRMGSYITVDGILLYIAELLEHTCSRLELGLDPSKCEYALKNIRQALEDASTPITIRIANSYGNIKVVKSYRGNVEKCVVSQS